ncbi:protein PXR1-like [Cryptomeria japonica]|uniref:protein PXR1-like n=1 Tax=Cryptomeria japonica TaxID=3369 RepID=UPI0027DAA640|nr:protein PXR1-like [Cryptomeria japonica]
MGDQTISIDEDLIAQVTGLCKEGSNYYRDIKLSKEAIERYPKTKKEKKHLVSTKPSSLKAKKKSKEKVFQIRSSSKEEVSEDYEKDEPQSPRKKKSKTSIQIRNKQKRQKDNDMELEEKAQRKDPDVDHKLEEEITQEGFDQRVDGNVDKITSGDVPKNEQDNSGEKTPPSNPPTEGLKEYVEDLSKTIARAE